MATALVVACAERSQPGDSGEQKVLRVGDAIACGQCRITFDEDAALRVPPDVDDALPLAVRVDAQERYWVFRGAELPALFDRSGRFLGTLGRQGSGPGEYFGAGELLEVGDTLIVFDARARRATLLTPDLQVRRTFALPIAVEGAVLVAWPDSVIVTGSVPGGDFGPVHRLSFRGAEASLASSLMAETGVHPDMLAAPRHRLTGPRGGRFWTAWESAYDLRQWTVEGTLLRTIERRPTWFPGIAPISYDWRNEPPPSYVGGLYEDDEGLLWVFIRVASPRWREAWANAPTHVNEARGDPELLYTTLLEIVDPAAGRVVARQSIDHYLVGVLPDSRVAFYETTDRGEGLVSVRTFRLVRP